MFAKSSIVIVALLWGVTNPLIKKGSNGVQKLKSKSFIKQTLLEIKFLFTNWKYLLPLTINQFGSVLYFLTLQDTSLSLIVPVTNSLTFLFTSLTSILLGEKIPSKGTILGMLLICLGALCCFLDKM